MKRLGIVLLTLVICHTPAVSEPSVTMPEELSAYAMSKGCEEVRDFFKRPGMINPPYVYGYLEGRREGSAVLWCERREGETRPVRPVGLYGAARAARGGAGRPGPAPPRTARVFTV